MELNSEHILVTGASGFIGRHLCRHVTAPGRRVVGVSQRHPDLLPDGVVPVHADLSDPLAARALIKREKPEIIFHLASCVKGSRDIALVRPTFDANLASTVYLLEAAAEHDCARFIVTGSLEEPDEVRAPPSSPYAAAKAAATAYARMFHALYQFPAVIARVFMVYGPDQKDQKKLIPYVINSLLQNKPPTMSSGTRQVDWIYVGDVVEGLVRLANSSHVNGRTVDIGTGQLETVRGVVERLARLMGSNAPLKFDTGTDRPLEQIRTADVAATEALTGWRPTMSLDDGLQATIAWHKKAASPPTLGPL